MSQQPEKKDPFDGEYIGNIWGWRVSLIGAAIIILLSAFAAYRHYTLDVPFGLEKPDQEGENSTSDSLRLEQPRQK